MRSNKFSSKETVWMSQFILTVSLAFILSCSAISQAGGSPQECDALFVQAAELEKQGNLIGAAALYDHCQQSAHEQQLRRLEAASLHRLAVIKAQNKKFTESASLFRQSIALDDKNVMILCDFAQLYADRRMYEDAETILKNALLIDPNNTHVLLNLGTIIAVQRDRQTEGLRYLKLALGEKAAYLELAKLYRSKGDMGQAEFAEQRAKLASDNPPAPVVQQSAREYAESPTREATTQPVVPVPIPPAPAAQPLAREITFQPAREATRPEVLRRVKEELLLLETQEIAAQQNTIDTVSPVRETPKPVPADPFWNVPIPVAQQPAREITPQPIRETVQQPTRETTQQLVHEIIAPYDTITSPAILRDPFIPTPQETVQPTLEWTAAKQTQTLPPAPTPKAVPKVQPEVPFEMPFEMQSEKPTVAVVQPAKPNVTSEAPTDFNPAGSQRDAGTLLRITAPPPSGEKNTLQRLSIPKQVNDQIIKVIPTTDRISNDRQLTGSVKQEQVKPIPFDPSSNVSIIAALPEYEAISIKKTPFVEDRDKTLTVQSDQLKVLNHRSAQQKTSTVANEKSLAKIAFVRKTPADAQTAAVVPKQVKTENSGSPGIVQPIGLISLDTRQPVSTIRPSNGSNSGFLVAQRNIFHQTETPKTETPKTETIQAALPKDAVVAPSEHQFARNTAPNILAFEIAKGETPRQTNPVAKPNKEEPKVKPIPAPIKEVDPFLTDIESVMPKNPKNDTADNDIAEVILSPDTFWDLSPTPSETPKDNSSRGFATTRSSSSENTDTSDEFTGFARSREKN